MTLRAKDTCPQLDGSYRSIGYDGSGGTRHICSRNSLVGVPGSSTTTKDNWTTVFWSTQGSRITKRGKSYFHLHNTSIPWNSWNSHITLPMSHFIYPDRQWLWLCCGQSCHTRRVNNTNKQTHKYTLYISDQTRRECVAAKAATPVVFKSLRVFSTTKAEAQAIVANFIFSQNLCIVKSSSDLHI